MKDYADLEKRLRAEPSPEQHHFWNEVLNGRGDPGEQQEVARMLGTALAANRAGAEAIASLNDECAKSMRTIAELREALDDGAYDFPKYGLHTQRKALTDLIAFIYREVIKRPELERLYDELRFPEDTLLSREPSAQE